MNKQEHQELQQVRVKNVLVNLESVYTQLFMNPKSAIRTASYSEALRADNSTSEEWLDEEFDDIEADLTNAIINLVIAGMCPQYREVHKKIMKRMLECGLDTFSIDDEDYMQYVKALIHTSMITKGKEEE